MRRNFFWGASTRDKNIAWVAWDNIMTSVKKGGLGVESLKTSNLAMLSKWWWRFNTEPKALWCLLIKSILENDGALSIATNTAFKSGTWYRISQLKHDFLDNNIDLPLLFMKKVHNGEDTSLGEVPF